MGARARGLCGCGVKSGRSRGRRLRLGGACGPCLCRGSARSRSLGHGLCAPCGPDRGSGRGTCPFRSCACDACFRLHPSRRSRWIHRRRTCRHQASGSDDDVDALYSGRGVSAKNGACSCHDGCCGIWILRMQFVCDRLGLLCHRGGGHRKLLDDHRSEMGALAGAHCPRSPWAWVNVLDRHAVTRGLQSVVAPEHPHGRQFLPVTVILIARAICCSSADSRLVEEIV
jgi:hypothetical protein